MTSELDSLANQIPPLQKPKTLARVSGIQISQGQGAEDSYLSFLNKIEENPREEVD